MNGPLTSIPGVLELQLPRRRTLPLVVAVPHAGRRYPPDLLAASPLGLEQLRMTEDALVDDLFAMAPDLGAPLIKALAGRAYLDVNRDARELDPRLIAERLPPGSLDASRNVENGLGVVPRLAMGGRAIYRSSLTLAEAERRIQDLHRPYHAALTRLVEETRAEFGYCLLIDAHSMPGGSAPGADIVLGDCFGESCDPVLASLAHKTLQSLGYRVERNRPYAGGFTTRHYGHPASHLHTLQIEIDRSLYMDERRLEAGPGFGLVAEKMAALMAEIGRFVPFPAR
jgi:N-formylglutamate amidohydrolase